MKNKFFPAKGNILFILSILRISLLVFICNSSLIAMQGISRNWKTSLNYSFQGYDHIYAIDTWIIGSKQYITTENRDTLANLLQVPGKSRNIANAEFRLIYTVEGENKIVTNTSYINSVFISGLGEFNESVGQQEKQSVEISNSFYPTQTGSALNASLKLAVNGLIGRDIVTEGTHSEALILLSLSHVLSDKINAILHHHDGKNIHILGSVLVVSSLKDPCTGSCLPMLKQFGVNLHNILRNKIPYDHRNKVNFAAQLETVILLAGRESYLDSRNNMHISSEPIVLDFDNPQTRIFSVQTEQLHY